MPATSTRNDARRVGSFGGAFDDVVFVGRGAIVLRGRTVDVLDAGFASTGRATLATTAQRLFLHDGAVFALGAAGGRIDVERVAPPALGLLPDGAPARPDGHRFVPDAVVQGDGGTVWVLSRALASIFRWEATTGAWGETIPLDDVPVRLAYASATRRLYLGGPFGTFAMVALDGAPAVTHFAGSDSFFCDPVAVDAFLFCNRHDYELVYGPDGVLHWIDFQRFPAGETALVWHPALRRVYGVQDLRLTWRAIDPTGALGEAGDAAVASASGILGPPLRLSPDGAWLVTGGGTVIDPVAMVTRQSLDDGHADAAWADDALYTLRNLTPPPDYGRPTPAWGVSELVSWGSPPYAARRRVRLPGRPHGLATGGGAPAALTSTGGVPEWIVPACGDGVRDGADACDGDDLGARSCETLGLGPGTLACTADCALDTRGCAAGPRCGNGVVDQADELCDGDDLGVNAGRVTCASLGFVQGAVRCAADCRDLDVSACRSCGNGKREYDRGEECDGADLANNSCVAERFAGGRLRCDDACTLDTSGCVEDCQPGRCDDGDPCTIDRCSLAEGCTFDPVPGCVPVRGWGTLTASTVVHQGGVVGDCRGRCRFEVREGFVVGGDTYRIPSTRPLICSDDVPRLLPDQVGMLADAKGNRVRLLSENAGVRVEALSACSGFPVSLRAERGVLVRERDGTLRSGRYVVATTQRRPQGTFRIVESTRFAATNEPVQPPKAIRRLDACSDELRLRCVAR